MPTKDQINEALKAVIDPELHHDIVSLGMVRNIEAHDDGRVDVVVSLTTPGCPIRSHFQNGVMEAVGALEGVREVNVGFDVLSQDELENTAASFKKAAGFDLETVNSRQSYVELQRPAP